MSFYRRLTTYFSLLLLLSILLQSCSSAPKGSPVPQTTSPEGVVSEKGTPVGQASATTNAKVQPTVEIRLSWDFVGEQQAQNWKATHDLAPFSFTTDGLLTRSTGGDPYMVGPSIQLDAASALHLEIRMRSSKGNDAQVFWEQNGQSFNEAASQHFSVNPDGDWHTYRLDLKDNPAWKGQITRLRLDPSNTDGAEIALAFICALGPLPPDIQATGFGPIHAILQENQPFELACEVRNDGDLASSEVGLKVELPAGLSLVEGEAAISAGPLEPGKTLTHTWKLSGNSGVYPLALLEGDHLLRQVTVVIETQSNPKTVILSNDSLRLAFPQQPFGYGVATLEWNHAGTWEIAGRLQSLGRITYQESQGEVLEKLFYASTVNQVDGQLSFDANFTDADGVGWESTVTFRLEPGKSWLELSYSLRTDRQVQILSWRGPEYLAGEGSFGSDRASGLFPGLEFLLGKEQSSGTDFASAAVSQRFVPNPNKITIPLMAITYQGLATGLMWDPLQIWEPDQANPHDRPAALFASPNRWESQENHLMSLLVPGITAGLVENHDQLDQPYLLASGQALKLNAALFAAPAADLLAPLEIWLDYTGQATSGQGKIPTPAGVRSSDQILNLCLNNYTKVTWVPEKKGWHYVLSDPWSPGSNPAIGLQLWLQTLSGKLPASTIDAWRKMVAQSLDSPPAGGQPNPWLYQTTLDLHMARPLAEIEKSLAMPLSYVSTQQPDGSWSYQPAGGNTPQFGQAGDTSNGYTATFALPVLYFARITGDQRLVNAGLKALAYLEMQPLRPEGAQTWELSLHVPDLLASAWVTQSFVEGYRLTGETPYLDLAQRWALAGLPFIYQWNAPDRPIMRFTTIPVFGASNYTYPWFGRAVMWNGLDYALGLQNLASDLDAAGISPIYNWQQLAEGITMAASQMLPTEGPFLGMYPDAWDNVTGSEAYTWNLTPSYLAQNLLLSQKSYGAQVQTRILTVAGKTIHINVPAQISDAKVQNNRIQLKFRYLAGQTVSVLFSSLDSAPRQVLIDGSPAVFAPNWKGSQSAWNFDQGYLLVRVLFGSTDETTLEIEP